MNIPTLFCLPYAGGSSTMYYRWIQILKPEIRVYPVELKGRGSRVQEKFYQSFSELINDIINIIKNDCNSEYAFFGYSMGGLIAYELWFEIVRRQLKKPCHIFLVSRETPDIKEEEISHLADDEFIEKLKNYGGIPNQIIETEEIRNFFLPILKSDFFLLEDYAREYKFKKINCNLSVIYGNNDTSINIKELKNWQKFTYAHCNLHELSDGHFLLKNNEKYIINLIKNVLLKNNTSS